MEEQEVPLEGLEDKIEETAVRDSKNTRWTFWVALSTALLAVLAAIAGLLSSHHSDEALIEQIRASDQWAFYQAKGIKSEILQAKIAMLVASNKTPDPEDIKKITTYVEEQKSIKAIAEERQKSSEIHQTAHMTFARSVTLFQIAIALSAISILTRRKALWFGSLAMAAVGAFFLLQALV